MKFLSFMILLPLASGLASHTEATIPSLETEIARENASTTLTEPTLRTSSSRLVMYVQTFTTPDKQPLSLLPLLEQQTRVTHIILASIHLQDQLGHITLNDDPLEAPMYDKIWEEVKTLQENGIKVMALLGGAAGGTYAKLNGTDDEFNTYYQPLLALLKKHNLDGLDIDIEEKVSISVPLRLINALYQDLGPSFILSMAPLAAALSDKDGYNLSGFSYFALDSLTTIPFHTSSPSSPSTSTSTSNLISFYNAQFYGGFARSPSFYKSIIDAGWDPTRIVMGVLDSENDGSANGFVDLQMLGVTVRGLRGMYGEFGGVAGWEYWDAGVSDGGIEGWEWVKRVGEALFGSL